MKRIALFMTLVAMMMTTSCSSLGGLTSNTAAVTAGAACSNALVSLRASHKAGTLSVTNLTDLSNMLIVVNSYNSLKANKDNASYKKSFVTGMVTGGNGIINASNASSIMNSLLNSTGLDGVNSSNIASKVQTVSAIVQLLSALN